MSAKEIQADSAHMSTFELSMSNNTAALWYRAMPSRHTWFWGSAYEAPQATSSAAAFYFSMTSGSGPLDTPEMQLPWVMHKAAVRIEADIIVACFPETSAKIRLETTAMGDAMSGVNGAYSENMSKVKSLMPPSGVWLQRAHALGYSVLKRVRIDVVPSPPSSRRFALRVRSSILDDSNVLRIYSITARDVMKGP